MCVCADQQPDVLQAQAGFLESQLELPQRTRIGKSRVHQDDSTTRADRPCVHMWYTRPGKGQPQAPQSV